MPFIPEIGTWALPHPGVSSCRGLEMEKWRNEEARDGKSEQGAVMVSNLNKKIHSLKNSGKESLGSRQGLFEIGVS